MSSEFRFVNAGEVFESSVGRQGFMPGGILCPPVLGVNYFFKPIDDAVSEHFAWFRREDWTSTDDGFLLTVFSVLRQCPLCLGGYFC